MRANGSGKSSLDRALRLLAETSQGGFVASLAREGGLPSTLWAGPAQIARSVKSGSHPVQGIARADAVHLRLGFGSDDFGFAIDLGLPSPPDGPNASAFSLDPVIKRECIWTRPVFRRAALMVDRSGPSLRAMDAGHMADHSASDVFVRKHDDRFRRSAQRAGDDCRP